MNQINRSVVKTQARQIIKGNFFYLFIITFIVGILTGGSSISYNFSDGMNSFSDLLVPEIEEYRDDYDIDEGLDGTYDENPFDSYGSDSDDSPSVISGFGTLLNPFILSAVSLSGIVSLVFTPLTVSLCGVYLYLIRRRAGEEFQLGPQLGGVFKNSFNNTYINKFAVCILRTIIMGLLFVLFIIPGIIFYYSSYFTYQIMSDNPNMKPMEAIRLSKKIVKGHRTELFKLDLSFIGWYILMGLTLGILSVYIIPYVNTTQALYYENFRMRALALGEINEDDFLSEAEKIAKYNASVNAQQPYNTQYNPTYYTPEASRTDTQQYSNSATDEYYFTPGVNTEPVEPTNSYNSEQQPYYYNPPKPYDSPYDSSYDASSESFDDTNDGTMQ